MVLMHKFLLFTKVIVTFSDLSSNTSYVLMIIIQIVPKIKVVEQIMEVWSQENAETVTSVNEGKNDSFKVWPNFLSAKFIKWSNTLKQLVGKLPTNCLSVFDHFVGLALKGLTL